MTTTDTKKISNASKVEGRSEARGHWSESASAVGAHAGTESEIVAFTTEDLNRYPLLCEVLRKRNLFLLAQYTTADVARIFECDVRIIQERIHTGKWKARDLPKRGRFLSCDLEAILQVPLEAGKTENLKGGR